MTIAGFDTSTLKPKFLAAAALLAAMVASPALATERCAGERFPLGRDAVRGSPYVNLQISGISGPFLLDYGSTLSSLSDTMFSAREPDNHLNVNGFSLPSFEGGRFRLASLGGNPGDGQGRLAGIVGTDFLSLLSADFRFDGAEADVRLSAEPCDRGVLQRRGLVPISQTGFFSARIERLRADRPNVPVLPLRIGGLIVKAQVDTGYDDRVLPPSVDVNDALYEALNGQGVLQAAGQVRVTTCHGDEVREVFRVSGAAVAIVDDAGGTVRRLEDVRLIRKHRNPCGGIARQDEPAAQLGVSILRQLSSMVFDPKLELVWIARDGS